LNLIILSERHNTAARINLEGVMNESSSETRRSVPIYAYFIFALYTLLFPAIIFLGAGTLQWPIGWLYYGIAVLTTIISRLLVARVNPDQLTERGRSLEAENTKSWDRTLSKLVGLVLPVVALTVIGLDHRWGWSPALPAWVPPAALILMLLGYALATWAFVVNRFFSGVVRIQEDRGHHVVTDGPYRYVRHPGYLGGLLAILATPLLLGSLWGFIPVALYFVLLVIRTALEDQTLQEELPGYQDYAQRTRYRLLPGAW
jgi:protein-S-isoprenylcysteine O-methyltransferase Ste14